MNRDSVNFRLGMFRSFGSLPATTAFSLLVLTERPNPTRLFLKKSRTSLPCPVQSRSENALRKGAPYLARFSRDVGYREP